MNALASVHLKKTKRLLFIEGDELLLEALSGVFHEHAFATLVATGGNKGLELARSRKPDCILMDLELPDIYGYTVLEALKTEPETRDIPIIVLLGPQQAEEKECVLELGAAACVMKSYNVKYLLPVVQQAIRGNLIAVHQVLITNHHSAHREQIIALLELEGFEVIKALDEQEVISLANDLQPDLILCDMDLPAVNGLMVLSKLKTKPETAHIPVFLVMEQANTDLIEVGHVLGASDYIIKPMNFNVLRSKIRNLTGKL